MHGAGSETVIVWRPSTTSAPSFSTVTLTVPPVGRAGSIVRTARTGTPSAKVVAESPSVHLSPPVVNPTDVRSGPPSFAGAAFVAEAAPDAPGVDGESAQPPAPSRTAPASPIDRIVRCAGLA